MQDSTEAGARGEKVGQVDGLRTGRGRVDVLQVVHCRHGWSPRCESQGQAQAQFGRKGGDGGARG